MADENQEQQEQGQEQGQEPTGSASQAGGIATGTAAKAVAAAAATGAAALAARKVMSGRGEGGTNGNSNGGSPQQQGGEGSILSTVLAGGWEAAREALLPAAEDAAGAAGEYVALHGPDVLRDRIVPRFVDSFNEARGGGS